MNAILLFVSTIFIAALFAIKFSHRYGIPSLFLFFLLGIGANALGVDFEKFGFMEHYAGFALFVIMFYGGYGTNLEMGLPVLRPAVALSSLGVVITALLTGLFAHYVLDFSLVEGMLFGSVIGSTDYASVSLVLQSNNLNLKYRSAPLLELESGSNDPTAYTMTLIFLGLLTGSAVSVPLLLLKQLAFALLVGYGMAKLFFLIHDRVNFTKEGLFTVFVFAMALAAFSLCGLADGNGYLAAYLFGVLIGNRDYSGKREMVFFFDGLTEIMQISLFFLLGFLSDPHALWTWFPTALAVMLFLLLVARPVAVFLLMRFFGGTFRQNLLLSWAGLRGAAAIVFAIMVVNSGARLESDIFHAALGVCLLSSLLQGSLLAKIAIKLDMIDPDDTVLKTFNYYQDRSDVGFLETRVRDDEIIGMKVKDLNLAFDFIVAKIERGGKTIVPHGDTVLQAGDLVVVGGKSHFDTVGGSLEEFTIRSEHPWANRRIRDLHLSPNELILIVQRNHNILVPSGDTIVCPGDKVLFTDSEEPLFAEKDAEL